MTGRLVRLSLASFMLLVSAMPAFAARRSSLAGNLLIQDMDDMFIFPHRIAEHVRLVTFDFGPNSGLGSGGMVFGNENLTFGAFAHRSDFYGALPDAFSLFPGTFSNVGDADRLSSAASTGSLPAFPAGALNWVDAILGFQVGENPWGLRLSLGRNQLDPPGDDMSSDVTAVNAIVGLQLTEWDIDLSGEISIASAETKTSATDKESSSPVGFAVAARKTPSAESEDLVLGWLGFFGYHTASEDVTDATGTATTDNTILAGGVGVGPVYHPSDRTQVAMYGTFEFERDKVEDDASAITNRRIFVPGWNIAAEVDLASWLEFRAGLRTRFEFLKNEDEDKAGGTTAETNSNDLSFRWTSGVGMHFGDFHLDGYFNPAVLTSGTDLFGNNSSLFGIVTGSYDF